MHGRAQQLAGRFRKSMVLEKAMSASLIAIDLFAAALVLIGFHVAFRQKLVRRWFGQLREDQPSTASAEDPLASVFRIVGVMLMAFGFTIGVFANLIAYYTAASGS